eukprot:scaffold1087_cov198-Pinguiococcus_pyrenoidosus.AAC.19
MYPMLSEECILDSATPITKPSAFRAGPPELPGLIAASICVMSCDGPPWTIACMVCLDTTPLVTLRLSPPCGKPKQTTTSCSEHGLAHSKSSVDIPAQNSAFSTSSSARSISRLRQRTWRDRERDRGQEVSATGIVFLRIRLHLP